MQKTKHPTNENKSHLLSTTFHAHKYTVTHSDTSLKCEISYVSLVYFPPFKRSKKPNNRTTLFFNKKGIPFDEHLL